MKAFEKHFGIRIMMLALLGGFTQFYGGQIQNLTNFEEFCTITQLFKKKAAR